VSAAFAGMGVEAAASVNLVGSALDSIKGRLGSFAASFLGVGISPAGIITGVMDKLIGAVGDILTAGPKRAGQRLDTAVSRMERVSASLSNVPMSYNVDLARHRIAGAGGGTTIYGGVTIQVDSSTTWDGLKAQMRGAAAAGDPLARHLVTAGVR
jgi:hypothetical protein